MGAAAGGSHEVVFLDIFFLLIWHARRDEHKDAAVAGLSPRSNAHVDTTIASPAHTRFLGSDFVVALANMRVPGRNFELLGTRRGITGEGSG